MEQDITDEIIKFLRISVTNVFFVVLLKPYFSSMTNVEYTANGISKVLFRNCRGKSHTNQDKFKLPLCQRQQLLLFHS